MQVGFVLTLLSIPGPGICSTCSHFLKGKKAICPLVFAFINRVCVDSLFTLTSCPLLDNLPATGNQKPVFPPIPAFIAAKPVFHNLFYCFIPLFLPPVKNGNKALQNKSY